MAPKLSARAQAVINTLSTPIANAVREGKSVKIFPGGTVVEFVPDPNTNVRLTQYQDIVGGDIELIPCVLPRWFLIGHASASIFNLPCNPNAYRLYRDYLICGHKIRGVVILTPKA